MSRKCVIFLVFLINIAPALYAQVRFEKLWENLFSLGDQHFVYDMIMLEDHLFLLGGVFIAHQDIRGSFVTLNGMTIWESMHRDVVDSGYDLIHPLQKRLVLSNGLVHLPDTNDSSFRFTLEGEMVGYFPNYRETVGSDDREYIRINGKLKKLPIDIFGHHHYSATTINDTILLCSDNNITAVRIDELDQEGEQVSYGLISREPPRNDRKKTSNFLYPVTGSYFLDRDKLYRLTDELLIIEVESSQLPEHAVGPWSAFIDSIYYQVEIGSFMSSNLVAYKVAGLDETHVSQWMLH